MTCEPIIRTQTEISEFVAKFSRPIITNSPTIEYIIGNAENPNITTMPSENDIVAELKRINGVRLIPRTVLVKLIPQKRQQYSDIITKNTTQNDTQSNIPSDIPSVISSVISSVIPSDISSDSPSDSPSDIPSVIPSVISSVIPSNISSDSPSDSPSVIPSNISSDSPSNSPSDSPSDISNNISSDIPINSKELQKRLFPNAQSISLEPMIETKEKKKKTKKKTKKPKLPEGMEISLWKVFSELKDIKDKIYMYECLKKDIPQELLERKKTLVANMDFLKENTDIYSSESEHEPSDDDEKPLHISSRKTGSDRKQRKPQKISRVVKERGFDFIRLYSREEAKEDFYYACELARRCRVDISDIEGEYEQLKENDLYSDACSLDDRLLSELSLDELIDDFVYPVYKRIADFEGIEVVTEFFTTNHPE
jgi:hypothetical protein